jgi:hypothetical protein
MLFDDSLVLGEVDAEGLVVSDIALDPLNVRSKLPQRLIRFRRSATNCSRSSDPTAGMSRSMMNFRNAIGPSRYFFVCECQT